VWTVPATTSGCSGSKYKIPTQKQTRTDTLPKTTTRVDDYTTPYTETIVTTNGTVTSDTTSTGSTTSSNVSPNTTTSGSATYSSWANSGSSSSSCQNIPGGLSAGSTGYSTSSNNFNTTTTGTQGSVTTTTGTATVTVVSTSNTATTTTTTDTSYAGSTDSLADVAEYYYITDLRNSALGHCTSGSPGNHVCSDNLPTALTGSLDTAQWQHMTTYTIGLGVNGTLTYDK